MKRIDLMLYLMGIYDNIFPNIQISHENTLLIFTRLMLFHVIIYKRKTFYLQEAVFGDSKRKLWSQADLDSYSELALASLGQPSCLP